MHNPTLHSILFWLLLLDVALVISSIALEIEYLHSKYYDCSDMVYSCQDGGQCLMLYFGKQAYHDAHIYAAYVSLTILSFFLIENFVLLFCMGWDFVKSPWHMLDIFVVSMSIFLEAVFMDQPEGGLLILARCWRFARIGHGLYETTRDKEKAEIQNYLQCYSAQLARASKLLQSVARPNSHQSNGSPLKLARSFSRSSSRSENSSNPLGSGRSDQIWKVLQTLHEQDPAMIPTVLLVAHKLLEKPQEEESALGVADPRSAASDLSVSLLAHNSQFSESVDYPSTPPVQEVEEVEQEYFEETRP
jgi:hypothetical protein